MERDKERERERELNRTCDVQYAGVAISFTLRLLKDCCDITTRVTVSFPPISMALVPFLTVSVVILQNFYRYRGKYRGRLPRFYRVTVDSL